MPRCSKRLGEVSERNNSVLEEWKLSWQAESAPCASQGCTKWVDTSEGPFLRDRFALAFNPDALSVQD